MRIRFGLTLVVGALCITAFTGCATKPVTFAQKDPQVDLYAFKTFSFIEPATGQQSGAAYSTLVNDRLKEATRAQLESLGYVYDESDSDLRVNIVLVVQERAEIRSKPNGGPVPYLAWGASNIETVEYRYGTLVIDLVDARRRTMVWRGVAEGRLSRKNMQDADGTARDSVRELFARYPRKA